MLLTVAKQNWCHFEALECTFHFGQEKFSLLSSADSQSRKDSVPELMLNPVHCTFHNQNCYNRVSESVVFNSDQKMALRAVYVVIAMVNPVIKLRKSRNLTRG